MTTYQEFMLSICFAFVILGWGYNIACLVGFIKGKIKARKEKKNQLIADDKERIGDNQ